MGKNIRLDIEKVFGTMESMEKMIAKGRDDMTKAKLVVSNDKDMPTSGKEFLGGLASAYDNLADAVEFMASIVVDLCKQKNAGGGER
jgi:hypothetical protein